VNAKQRKTQVERRTARLAGQTREKRALLEAIFRPRKRPRRR
jgi:hypothetical protein